MRSKLKKLTAFVLAFAMVINPFTGMGSLVVKADTEDLVIGYPEFVPSGVMDFPVFNGNTATPDYCGYVDRKGVCTLYIGTGKGEDDGLSADASFAVQYSAEDEDDPKSINDWGNVSDRWSICPWSYWDGSKEQILGYGMFDAYFSEAGWYKLTVGNRVGYVYAKEPDVGLYQIDAQDNMQLVASHGEAYYRFAQDNTYTIMYTNIEEIDSIVVSYCIPGHGGWDYKYTLGSDYIGSGAPFRITDASDALTNGYFTVEFDGYTDFDFRVSFDYGEEEPYETEFNFKVDDSGFVIAHSEWQDGGENAPGTQLFTENPDEFWKTQEIVFGCTSAVCLGIKDEDGVATISHNELENLSITTLGGDETDGLTISDYDPYDDYKQFEDGVFCLEGKALGEYRLTYGDESVIVIVRMPEIGLYTWDDPDMPLGISEDNLAAVYGDVFVESGRESVYYVHLQVPDGAELDEKNVPPVINIDGKNLSISQFNESYGDRLEVTYPHEYDDGLGGYVDDFSTMILTVKGTDDIWMSPRFFYKAVNEEDNNWDWMEADDPNTWPSQWYNFRTYNIGLAVTYCDWDENGNPYSEKENADRYRKNLVCTMLDHNWLSVGMASFDADTHETSLTPLTNAQIKTISVYAADDSGKPTGETLGEDTVEIYTTFGEVHNDEDTTVLPEGIVTLMFKKCGAYVLSYTPDGEKPQYVSLNVDLPEVGIYSADELSEENLLAAGAFSDIYNDYSENKTYYVLHNFKEDLYKGESVVYVSVIADGEEIVTDRQIDDNPLVASFTVPKYTMRDVQVMVYVGSNFDMRYDHRYDVYPKKTGLVLAWAPFDEENDRLEFNGDYNDYRKDLDPMIRDDQPISVAIASEDGNITPVSYNDLLDDLTIKNSAGEVVFSKTVRDKGVNVRLCDYRDDEAKEDVEIVGVACFYFAYNDVFLLEYNDDVALMATRYPDIAVSDKLGTMGYSEADLNQDDLFDSASRADFGGYYQKKVYIDTYQYEEGNYKRDVKITKVSDPIMSPGGTAGRNASADAFRSKIINDGKNVEITANQKMYTYWDDFHIDVEYTVTEYDRDGENAAWNKFNTRKEVREIWFYIPPATFVNAEKDNDAVKYTGFFINDELFKAYLKYDELPYDEDGNLQALENSEWGYNKTYWDVFTRGDMPIFNYESDSIQGVIDGLLKSAAVCQNGGSVKVSNADVEETAFLDDIVNTGYIAITILREDGTFYQDKDGKPVTEVISNTSGLKGIAYSGGAIGPSIRVNVTSYNPSDENSGRCDLKFYGDMGDDLILGYPAITEEDKTSGAKYSEVTLIEGCALEREYVPTQKNKPGYSIAIEGPAFSADGSKEVKHTKDDVLADLLNQGKPESEKRYDKDYSYNVKTFSINVKTETEGNVENKELLDVETPDYNSLDELDDAQVAAIEEGKELTITMEADSVNENSATAEQKESIEKIKDTINTEQTGYNYVQNMVSFIDVLLNAVVEGIDKKTPITQTTGYIIITVPVPAMFANVPDNQLSLVRGHKDPKGSITTDVFRKVDDIQGKESLNVFSIGRDANNNRFMRIPSDRFSTFAIVQSEKIESTEKDEETGRDVYYYDLSKVKWDYSSAFTYDGKAKTVKLVNVPKGVSVNYIDNVKTEIGTYTAIAEFSLEEVKDDTYATCVYKLPEAVSCNSAVSDNKPYITWEIKKAESTNNSSNSSGGSGGGSGGGGGGSASDEQKPAVSTNTVSTNTVSTNTTDTAVKEGDSVKVDSAKATFKITAVAADGKAGTVTYISADDKTAKKITVPSKVTIDGKEYTVTAIGDKAFKGCKKLEVVKIPNTVTSIGKAAFAGVKTLKKVVIPKNVTKIDAKAFKGDKALKTVKIKSKKIKSIGKKAFAGVKATVKVPKAKKAAYSKMFKKAGLKGTVK